MNKKENHATELIKLLRDKRIEEALKKYIIKTINYSSQRRS